MYIVWFISAIAVLGIGFYLALPLIDAWRCKAIIQKHSATFYKAFSTINNQERKNGIYAVYAFCRYVDDVIDEEQDVNKLNQVEKKLQDFVKRGIARDFRFRSLKRTAQLFYKKNYSYQPYFDMIQGQRLDSEPVIIKTISELEIYCDLVASSVGYMLLPILAPNQETKLEPFAIALGRAFQITNILRDVGEDFQRDRIYFPAELLRQFDVNLALVIEGNIAQSFIDLWEFLAKKAESYYTQALSQIKSFPRDTQFPLAAALFFYRDILNACRNASYQVITQKNYVSHERKKSLLRDIQSFLSV
jgi:phytoene synthase